MGGCNNCDEHAGLMEYIGTMKGQIGIILKLMIILVAGMGYAITQNHASDLKLVSVDNRVASTERINPRSVSHKGLSSSISIIDKNSALHAVTSLPAL